MVTPHDAIACHPEKRALTDLLARGEPMSCEQLCGEHMLSCDQATVVMQSSYTSEQAEDQANWLCDSGYRDELIAAAPPKFDGMREEFRMMNLRQRVVDWRVAELRRMQAHLEKKQKAREDEGQQGHAAYEAEVAKNRELVLAMAHQQESAAEKAKEVENVEMAVDLTSDAAAQAAQSSR